MRSSSRDWNNIRGDWIWENDNLKQNEIDGITRLATNIGHEDFVLTFTFCFTDMLQ